MNVVTMRNINITININYDIRNYNTGYHCQRY